MQFKTSKLKNKLNLILAPLAETQAVTALVLIPVGSRYESPAINGSAHYIEHLMFKGTQKRPTALDISKELDGVGANYNAFTGKEYTGYYIKVAAKHLELGLDILSDMVFNSVFKAEEFERERGVILEEIKMYEDNPIMYIEDLFEQTLFAGNPLGWNIAGTAKVFKKITRAQLLTFKQKFYQPQNLTLVLAGQVDGKALKLAEKYFGAHTNKTGAGKVSDFKSIKIAPTTAAPVAYRQQKVEQVQMAVGFPSFKHGDERNYALNLLAVILGGNMSSRLFIKVRERNGLAYHIHCETNTFRDIGEFSVRAGIGKNNVVKALDLICAEFGEVLKNGVTAHELSRAKEFLKGKITLSLEDSANIAEWCGQQWIYDNKILTPEQKMAKYNAVTLADIAKAAKAILKPEKITLALIGSGQKPENLKKSLRF